MTADDEAKIDQLLHDAEIAEAGAGIARTVEDFVVAHRLEDKAERLRGKARKLDPKRESRAWPILRKAK